MTFSARKLTKFKTVTATATLLLAGFAQPAMAQVTTDDRTAQEWLEYIAKSVSSDGRGGGDTVIKETQELDKFNKESTTQHYAKQVTHYKQEIARLDAMIDAMGFYTVDGDSDIKAETDEKVKQAFDVLIASTEGRSRITNARSHSSAGAGFTVGNGDRFSMPFSSNDEPDSLKIPQAYYERYGIVPAKEIYDKESTYRNIVDQLHGALFLNEATVFEVDQTRVERQDAYKNLLEKARTAGDLHTTMQVNNAIMLENGRNLAMLIDLQTAQLNAGSVALRDRTEKVQKTTKDFGDGDGDLNQIALLVAATNAVADVVD